MIKRNIYLLYAITFLTGMVFYASIATLYRQNSGISIFQISLIESISFILSLLLEVPFGIIADKIGYKKTMVLSLLFYAFSKFIFWRADCFAMFLLERILLSISLAGLSGVDDSILYLSSGDENYQKNSGINSSMGTAGLLIAAAVYSVFIGDKYRLSGLFTLISYCIAALLSFLLVEVKQTEKNCLSIRQELKSNLNVLVKTLSNKKLLFIVLGLSLFSESQSIISVFLTQLRFETLGLSYKIIGIIYMVTTSIDLLSFASDFITKKTGRTFLIITDFFIGIGGIVVFSLTKNIFVAVGTLIVICLVSTLTGPLYSKIYNENIEEDDRATVLSMLFLITDFVSVFVQLVIGKIADFNLTEGLLSGSVISIIGFMFIILSGILNINK